MRISSLNHFCKSIPLRRFIQITTGTALQWQPTQTDCSSTASPAGNILDLKYNYNSSSQTDNGNVMGITNNRDTTRSQSFTYDQVNRILSAQTSSTSGSNCWGEAYGYDQWANLTNIGAVSGYSGCTQESLSVSAGTNNQLTATGYTYDALGNMLTDVSNTYVFNAESEIKTAASVNYTYDGDGNRMQKSNGKIYWYGAGTEILDESDASGNFTDEYVFFGGERIAHRSVSSNTIYYYAEDLLGTSRTLVQAGQTSLCYDADFYPFGGERDVTTTCSQNYKFESKERDSETGNDDFGARYYSSRIGRWLSSDWSAVPAPVPYANLSNPQTLNLYAMVRDNPETFADLDGHLGGVGKAVVVPQCGSTPSTGTASSCGASTQNTGTAQNQTPQPLQQNPQQQDQNQPQQPTPSQASAGVGALPLIGRIIVGGEDGAEVGTGLGSAEPGGGNAVGAVAGAVAGAVTAALAPAVYSKAKDEAAKGWAKFKTAIEHYGKLNSSPDKDPRKGWKNTMRRVADDMDRHADKMGQNHPTMGNALRLGADFVRGIIPND